MPDDVVLRAPTDDDLTEIARVVDAQEITWWGEPDGDIDDTRGELERAVRSTGSLDAGARIAAVAESIVGVGLILGHGHTRLAVDPESPFAAEARRRLIAWLIDHGGDEIESPSQDVERLAELASFGLTPVRSSFELERRSDVSDLPTPDWPDGHVPVPFRPGIDDEELYAMLYEFWADVPGHTHRTFAEWRSLVLLRPWFAPDLVVVVRSGDGTGPIVGCGLCRTFGDRIGWVSQLGVAREVRGLGLGRAILLEACQRLSRTGVELIGLGVEARNENALGLYRSVGLDVAREFVHCARP